METESGAVAARAGECMGTGRTCDRTVMGMDLIPWCYILHFVYFTVI